MCVYLLEPRCKLRGIKSPSMGIKSLLPADMSHDDECSYTVAVVLSFVLKFTWARKKKEDIRCAIYIITACLRVVVLF